jgi:hypothetical protein
MACGEARPGQGRKPEAEAGEAAMIDHERLILGHLIMQPELLKMSDDLKLGFFEDEKYRKTFGFITEIFEDNHSDMIDIRILADRLGGDKEAFSFINSLLDGVPRSSPKNFLSFIREAKKAKVARKIFNSFEEEQRLLIKTTGNFDPSKIRPLYDEYDQLCQPDKENAGSFFGTVEDFMAADIPPEEVFCDSLIFRGGLIEVGGMKGTHKSFLMNSLALHLASGRSPFLNFTILRPYRVLLIQQEISVGQHRARMERMIKAGQFETGGRLFTFTTTGKQRKLERQEDLAEIKKWIGDCKPDVLLLDPLSSFEQGEENNSRDRKRTVSILNELKATFGLALVVSHHFSSKVSPDDPLAPKEAGGWFRGHSAFPDAADTLICLHRLPGQRENSNLPKSYEDYNLIEIQTRNGRWPARFAVEFDDNSFLLKPSTIWEDIKKKIIPGEITDYIDDQGGEALYKDILEHFKNKADRTTVRRAIRAEVKAETLEEARLPGKGRPLVIRRLNAHPPESPAYPSYEHKGAITYRDKET